MSQETFALGRIEEHDPLSKNFPAPVAAAPLHSIQWLRHGNVFDQGQIGSCTGNACMGTLMTLPYWNNVWSFTEKDALAAYSGATHLDRSPGFYPPNDTGSSGLAVSKWAKNQGYITSYHHAFGTSHALGALMLSPLLLGIPWYDSMFQPDKNGVVSITPNSEMVGGHEISVVGYDIDKQLLKFANSWGKSWGTSGYGYLKLADFSRLLGEGGDVTVMVK